ncbi:MAG: hypothetical protein ACJ71Q_01735 [Terriglobales bacterium]|jgi:hypothetical protein
MTLYLKSTLTGLFTLLLFIVISPFIVLPILSYRFRKQMPGAEIGWDPVSLVKHSPTAWLILALAFAVGFAWKYIRLTRTH